MNTTPAPWTLTIGDHDASIHAGVTIATVTDEATNWRANAALIAQAPALLATLENLLAELYAHHKMNVRKDFSLMCAAAAAQTIIHNTKGY